MNKCKHNFIFIDTVKNEIRKYCIKCETWVITNLTPESVPNVTPQSTDIECPAGKKLHDEYMLDGHCSHCHKSANKCEHNSIRNIEEAHVFYCKDCGECHGTRELFFVKAVESTEMEEWERRLTCLFLQDVPNVEIHNFVRNLLSSHSKKLVIEHCDEIDCPECQTKLLDKYKKELIDKIEQYPNGHEWILKENIINIINS